MIQVSTREARIRLAKLLDAVAAGDTVEITRHGRPVARITAPRRSAPCAPLPDMEAFHQSLTLTGKPLSQLVNSQRRSARY